MSHRALTLVAFDRSARRYKVVANVHRARKECAKYGLRVQTNASMEKITTAIDEGSLRPLPQTAAPKHYIVP
jgi:hypothetical protein